jgi:hypothetical protein
MRQPRARTRHRNRPLLQRTSEYTQRHRPRTCRGNRCNARHIRTGRHASSDNTSWHNRRPRRRNRTRAVSRRSLRLAPLLDSCPRGRHRMRGCRPQRRPLAMGTALADLREAQPWPTMRRGWICLELQSTTACESWGGIPGERGRRSDARAGPKPPHASLDSRVKQGCRRCQPGHSSHGSLDGGMRSCWPSRAGAGTGATQACPGSGCDGHVVCARHPCGRRWAKAGTDCSPRAPVP